MTIELPWPPSLNNIYANSKSGGRFPVKRARVYREEVILAVRQLDGPRKVGGRLRVRIAAFPPNDHRKHDLDNIIKPILDGLKKAEVFEDDSMVDDLHVMRGEAVDDGAVHVTVATILDAALTGATQDQS